MEKTKVFCIGFQKTGTSSMRDALKMLGYRVAGVYGREQSIAELRATYVEEGMKIAQSFDAVEDMPWPLLFRELDQAYPRSKFILTVRETGAWYKSISDHFGATPSAMQQLTYGDDAPAPVGHQEEYCRTYEAHNLQVREYFRSRPSDLLVMELEEGDGWNALGTFLGVEVPDGPFVRTNTAEQRKSLGERLRRKLQKMGFPVATMDG